MTHGPCVSASYQNLLYNLYGTTGSLNDLLCLAADGIDPKSQLGFQLPIAQDLYLMILIDKTIFIKTIQ